MNRYLFHSYVRPRKLSGFVVGDRVVDRGGQRDHGTIIEMDPWIGKRMWIYISWDKPRMVDHPYTAEELEHEQV